LDSGGLFTETHPSFVVDAKTCKSYPPAWMYLRRLLKQFILAAESDGEEVLDSLYELHAIYLLPSQVTSRLLHSKSRGRLAPFPSFLVIKLARSSLCSLNELYVVCQVFSITSFFTSLQCFF
jgi:hypothetical protein